MENKESRHIERSSNKWSKISIESASAILTWFLVSGSALYFMLKSTQISNTQSAIAACLFISYLVFWLLLSRQAEYKNESTVRSLLLLATFVNVIAIYFTVPFVYTAIFMIIWSAALPYFIKAKTAFLISPLWSCALYFVYAYYWGFSGMAVSAMLFWTFNLFALVMVNTAIKEKESREKVEMINLELLSTQQLLEQAAEQAERVRIARNIHDLLGHHLTALTINLQVAGRQIEQLEVPSSSESSKEAIKGSIEQCHSLSKLLLSDVREAVSDIRTKSSLNLEKTILAITSRLPNIKVSLDYPDNIVINDVNTADVLTRCIQESITNAIKHSQSKSIHIAFAQTSEQVTLSIKADLSRPVKSMKTTSNPSFQLGNGLLGMQERLKQMNGTVTFDLSNEAFTTDISIPVLDHD
ncbi:histidine kinase [Glaciecola sp. MF2-115]|uniref:histidine kinase n=1 Tax=Glaciecola sp. MF2-115 TaxID=3384827 RepID=UPI0039A35CBB